MAEAEVAVPRLTEAEVLSLLRQKHSRPGNGGSGEFAFATHVRNGAGFDATRTFDAVAMSLLPSRGHAIDIFEVKVSRSDWQRELREGAKAEAAYELGDRFSMVAPAGCVHDGELPPAWGLIEVLGDGSDVKPWRLRTKKAARWLRPGEITKEKPLDRGWLVCLFRGMPGAVPGGKMTTAADYEIAAAVKRGRDAATFDLTNTHRWEVELLERTMAEWASFRDLLLEHGLPGYASGANGLSQHVDAIVAAVLGAKHDRDLTRLRQQLTDAIDQIDLIQPPAPETPA